MAYPLIVNISLPKTSSTSLSKYCSQFANSTHEAWHSGLTDAIHKHCFDRYPKQSLLNYYLLRQLMLNHVVDSSTFNHFVPHDLVKMFSNSSFVYINRDMSHWICSMLNMWAYFADVHLNHLSSEDPSVVLDTRIWISWINRYSVLYSSSLNTYKVRDAVDSHDCDLMYHLVKDLSSFWIRTSFATLDLYSVNPDQIYIFDMSDLSSLSFFIQDLFSRYSLIEDDYIPSDYPLSNQYDFAHRQEKYFSISCVNNYLSRQLFDVSLDISSKFKSLYYLP